MRVLQTPDCKQKGRHMQRIRYSAATCHGSSCKSTVSVRRRRNNKLKTRRKQHTSDAVFASTFWTDIDRKGLCALKVLTLRLFAAKLQANVVSLKTWTTDLSQNLFCIKLCIDFPLSSSGYNATASLWWGGWGTCHVPLQHRCKCMHSAHTALHI